MLTSLWAVFPETTTLALGDHRGPLGGDNMVTLRRAELAKAAALTLRDDSRSLGRNHMIAAGWRIETCVFMSHQKGPLRNSQRFVKAKNGG